MSAEHIYAKIVADSIHPDGVRLTTMEVNMHRFILAEFNTHRRLSRNSASSRAIPFSRQVERLLTETAVPVAFPGHKAGMSGDSTVEVEGATEMWLAARDSALEHAQRLHSAGVHKSVVNRIIEPWLMHRVIVTSTEWDNLFNQRAHQAAQPEFRELAYMMRDALNDSEPSELSWGEWHLPYVGLNADDATLSPLDKVKVSTARCARVSYLTHDGQRNISEDIRMFDQTLWSNGHWSPMEHPALADPGPTLSNFDWGWKQARFFAERGELHNAVGSAVD